MLKKFEPLESASQPLCVFVRTSRLAPKWLLSTVSSTTLVSVCPMVRNLLVTPASLSGAKSNTTPNAGEEQSWSLAFLSPLSSNVTTWIQLEGSSFKVKKHLQSHIIQLNIFGTMKRPGDRSLLVRPPATLAVGWWELSPSVRWNVNWKFGLREFQRAQPSRLDATELDPEGAQSIGKDSESRSRNTDLMSRVTVERDRTFPTALFEKKVLPIDVLPHVPIFEETDSWHDWLREQIFVFGSNGEKEQFFCDVFRRPKFLKKKCLAKESRATFSRMYITWNVYCK